MVNIVRNDALALSETSSTASATPVLSAKPKSTEVLHDLKERIASRVAELNLVEKRGIIGVVDSSSDTQISVLDKKDEIRIIDVDELTRFASPSAKESFGISDIKKGLRLEILGLYNKQSKRILARFISVFSSPLIIHGTVTTIDTKNFAFNVTTEKKKTYIIDVERTTKTQSYTKEKELTVSGFSKITRKTHAIIIGFPDNKDTAHILAARILLFPEIPGNPNIIIPEEALEPIGTTTPSTGSGVKLTPIKQ